MTADADRPDWRAEQFLETEAIELGHAPALWLDTRSSYGSPYRFMVRCSCDWSDGRASLGRAWAAWLDHAAAMIRDRT